MSVIRWSDKGNSYLLFRLRRKCTMPFDAHSGILRIQGWICAYCSQCSLAIERLVTRLYAERIVANLQKVVFLWEAKVLLCKLIDLT